MSAEDVWAIFRQELPRGETVRAVVPWGGDRAVLVSDGGIYLIEYDDVVGMRIFMINSR